MELAKRNLPSDMAGTLCLAFCFVNLSVSFCLVNLNSAQGKENNSSLSDQWAILLFRFRALRLGSVIYEQQVLHWCVRVSNSSNGCRT